jgi:hypothetical protein
VPRIFAASIQRLDSSFIAFVATDAAMRQQLLDPTGWLGR